MLASAKSKYVRISPYKLRPIVDVIRGYSVDKALVFLKNCALKRVKPVEKILLSAYANGKNLNSDITSMSQLFIKEIKVDQGPIIKYYKPGAMGRASIQKKRLSHLEIVLGQKDGKVEKIKSSKKDGNSGQGKIKKSK